MPFLIIILTRILFAASMVLIIGYVFGNFAKNRALTNLTKFASVLVVVLFISASIFFSRFGRWGHGNYRPPFNCGWHRGDSTLKK